MQQTSYPAGPTSVPENLTKPSSTYKSRAWLAVAGLLLFVAFYVFFAAWFAWTAYSLIAGAVMGSPDGLFLIVGGAVAAFLSLFMIKSLFFIKKGGKTEDIEITAQQQPRLFKFLHRLADEAGAPKPHRVYLSARVNACVFYDLSILNLLWPSRKNLEIGLGLVNVLTLSEFKAVCAHEFGHFAQRSMRVGIWVYLAQQIASDIVAKRDGWDDFLSSISRMDFRIAWVGWLLGLIVWSVRSLVDSVFRIVVLAQRALSREMEMQADLVAVSLTGSDALIHALHKLQAADDAWDRTLSFVNYQLNKKQATQDVFAIQTRIIERLGVLFDDPSYGKQPTVAAENPQSHRVFKVELAQPPRMWSTHPLNHEREENAKRQYIDAELDSRSAWDIFEAPQALREEMSAHLARSVDEVEPVSMEVSLAELDQQYDHAYFDRAYRGVYLGRSPVINARMVDDLYQLDGHVSVNDLTALYPETLNDELERLRNLESECALLESLREGSYTTQDGVIRHRGKQLKRRELTSAINMVRKEADALRDKVCEHDRRCRMVHSLIAQKLGRGWDAYLRGLTHVLHYATHTEADLNDAHAYFHNVLNIETVTRNVSSSGVTRIISAGNQLYQSLLDIYEQRESLLLDQTLLERLEIESWSAALGNFELSSPSKEYINEWIQVIDGWVGHVSSFLSALRSCTLEQLLLSEAEVAKYFREGLEAPDAPKPSSVPEVYSVLFPGCERKRQTKLDAWQRFQVADGFMPALARVLVALLIVGSVLGFGSQMGSTTLSIYNGLARSVNVNVNGKSVLIDGASSAKVSLPSDRQYTIKTTDTDGNLIESFEEKIGFNNTVYNVAGASPLVEWTMVYGNAEERPNRLLGATRWFTSKADVLFEEPPSSVSTSKHSSGATRQVLSGLGNMLPGQMLGYIDDRSAQQALVTQHATWDAFDSPYILDWLYAAMNQSNINEILSKRLQRNPQDIAALRIEQDSSVSDSVLHTKVCERQSQLAKQVPDNVDLQYLAIRCIADKHQQAQAFLKGHAKWPQNAWFAYAVAYDQMDAEQWDAALANYEIASSAPVLTDKVNMLMARIYRLKHKSMKPFEIEGLMDHSPSLQLAWALENGREDIAAPYNVYSALAEGSFDMALLRVKNTPQEMHTLWFVAASDGATKEQVQQALALKPGDGIDNTTVWMAMALAVRNNKDAKIYFDAYVKSIGQNDEQASQQRDQLLQFLDLANKGKITEANNLLQDISLEGRGVNYSMGVILLGQKAPESWRNGAKYLLFANERPYFI